MESLFETNFPTLELLHCGKVRDTYAIPNNNSIMLIVSTDRISAFDFILPNTIPGKGGVLNQMSVFWFENTRRIINNHFITSDVDKYPDACKPYADILRGRSMLVKKAKPLPVEAIVRGFISGSGWEAYKETGEVCGIKLPDYLVESSELPMSIFTPSTKAIEGEHDENISFDQLVTIIGQPLAYRIRDISLRLYEYGKDLAHQRGIIIADTKFEFGIWKDEVILIDEVMTPDSSRFWPMDTYKPGWAQKSYDKQFLRDWLKSIGWNKKPPAPALPEDVIMTTSQKYLEALKIFS